MPFANGEPTLVEIEDERRRKEKREREERGVDNEPRLVFKAWFPNPHNNC